ncbi:phage tail tape measure protein [Serratia marcescens]|uniref:Phage tail tape measure protein n=1 Tax=Serratia marcescens TaxID=615 RepID=A0A1Q4P3D7_SERMA|nr:phage tail tape measure protein [Serratia marcescens]OKB67661.1 phage tail tape measure protein [Serratia marcescens]
MSDTDSKEALKNADNTVREFRQKLKTERKNQSQLAELLKVKAAQANALRKLDEIRHIRASLPAFLSSPEDIATAQQANLNYVVQSARKTLTSRSQQRLERQLQAREVDTADLPLAQRKSQKKADVTQGILNHQRGIRQDLRQNRRQEVLGDDQNRQEKIGKLRAFSAQSAETAGKIFGAGKTLFTPGMKFEQQMSGVQAQLGLDNGDPHLTGLRRQATGMAAEGQSAQEVVQAQSALASAGYNAQEVLTAAPAALNLANASGSSIEEAVKALTGIQSTFQLPVAQAGNIADVLTKAGNRYQLSLSELETQLRTAAPAAKRDGLGLEQTAAQLAPQGRSLGSVDGAAQMLVTVRGDNLDGDIKKLFASWDSLRIGLFDGQNTALRQLTQAAAGWLIRLGQWTQANPELANTLMTVGIAITALVSGLSSIGVFIAPALSAISMLMAGAGLLGTVFTSVGGIIAGAFTALSLPIAAVVAAIIGGAALIYKYWEPISAFMGGVASGFAAAISPIVKSFAPMLEVFEWVIDLVKQGFNALLELLAPIQMTQEGLNNAAGYGKAFGEALTAYLTWPTAMLAKLSNGVIRLLKALGLLSGNQPELDDEQIKTVQNDLASSGLIEGAAVQNYQPAMAPGAISTANNRNITNHMTINTTPGMDRREVEQIINHVNRQNQLDKENAVYSEYRFA